MQKIKINLENCYGIKKLDHEFEFQNRTFAIYAPNGVMKTSFAKTMDDLSKGNEPSDLAFPKRVTVCEALIDEQPINPKNIFVIEPHNPKYKSEKIATLLANKDLQEQYNAIHKDIDKTRVAFVKKLKQLSGLTGKAENLIEGTIEQIFGDSFYDVITNLAEQIKESPKLPFHEIQYKIIFSDKVQDFLKTGDFKQSLEAYIKQYDELIDKSPYLGKDFKFHHAEEVQKQLFSNNFFKGQHSVNLFDGEKDNKYDSDENLSKILKEEKEKIFSDEILLEKFNEISGKLSTKELKEFRDYLLDNQEILPQMNNLDEFRKQLWLSYFVDQKELFLELFQIYKDGRDGIQKLVTQAKKDANWEDIIRIFNSRFSHLPFDLRIKNKEDVILKGAVETIEFIFKDNEEERNFANKDDLLQILSMGEQRALYILNIIFEIEARKKEDGETLLILDDIADSFDYKNKYAIIEYLKSISETPEFYMIILTHNFDFFRTIQSRGITKYSQCLMAIKNNDNVALVQMEGIKNPFIHDWKGNLTDNKKLIASIPFIRNLIEYTQGVENDSYLLLTNVLHYKPDAKDTTINEVGDVFNDCIPNINFPTHTGADKIIDLIYSVANECLRADEGINLENKIVLSIAIRLKAEQFMFSKITDTAFLSGIGLNQNWKLLRKYAEEYNNKEKNIETLKKVNLITPENIHLNSFMYEPILDMGDGELRNLYESVRDDLE